METVFMNTEISNANESNKFIYQFADKLNLKTPNNKNTGLVNLIIHYSWKNIKSAYSNNKFKYLLQLGMMNLICLMDDILFQTSKIILSTLF